ncbi:unnamed protein product [Linum trigynum]|uniref:Uncharacterized protein n=1 Tax=Linum trigynum TaxID=586398 RepID=A0AAV2DAY2_9ROSI
MDPHGFSNQWGYPPPSEWYYPATPYSNQGGEDYGFGFQYQPPFYGEQPDPWAYQEQSPYQEEFFPQPGGPSDLELPMAAFMGHSAEPCYTPQPDPNYELRLLVEQIARVPERSFPEMDPHIQAIAQTDFSYRETEETLLSIKKSLEDLEKAYAQPAQDHPSAIILEEEEEDEGYKDIVEQTEVFTKSSRDDHDQEFPAVADHTFPHPKLSFEEAGMSEEMQENLMKEIAWQLALQSVLEEEERERVQKEVVEDEESEAGGVLDLFPGVIPHEEEREVEEAIGVQAEDGVKVEEACTGHELHVISPPNFEELLGKDPFAVSLCQTKATSTSVPLGGRDGGQSMLSYLVWGNETRDEKKRSRGWRLHLHQVHEPSSPATPHARDLRLHLIDENLNFKEVLAWTKI